MIGANFQHQFAPYHKHYQYLSTYGKKVSIHLHQKVPYQTVLKFIIFLHTQADQRPRIKTHFFFYKSLLMVCLAHKIIQNKSGWDKKTSGLIAG